MTATGDLSFWRNLALITVAHAAVLVGLMRWGGEVKRAAPANVVWLATGGALPPLAATAPAVTLVPGPLAEEPVRPVQEQEQESLTPTELPMPTATAAPTTAPRPVPTPKAKTSPKPKPSAAPTPKTTPKPAPKKAAVAKASPRPSAPAAVKKQVEERAAENAPVSAGDSSAQGAAGSGENDAANGNASQFNWYGNMLHDRFQGEWVQPKTAAATGARMSTLVQLRIEKDGRVSDFRIVRSSGNVVVDESINAVAKRVTKVDPPPAPLAAAGHYDVRINFELNVE